MFRLMFCVLIALLLSACDQAGPQETSPSSAVPGLEPSDTNANNGTKTTESAAEIPASPSGLTGPGQLIFEETTADFGRLTENEERTRRLSFRNAGGTTLRIVDLKGTCGCTIPQMPKRVWAPGEEGELTVTFDPSGEGEQLKYVNIVTDQPEPHNFLRLTVKANVVGLVRAVPKILAPNIDQTIQRSSTGFIKLGDSWSGTFKVFTAAPTLKIVDVTASNPVVQLDWRELTGEERPGDAEAGEGCWEIRCAVPTADRWGSFFSWVRPRLEGPTEPGGEVLTHTGGFRIQAKVWGAVEAVDWTITKRPEDTFRFGAQPGQGFVREMLLRSRGGPFELQSATVNFPQMPGSTVVIEPSPEATPGWLLRLNCPGGDSPGEYQGEVIVRTTLAPPEDRLVLPIVGRVRSPADIGR
ncbi:MAG: hypothetical protein CMJ37_04165 [Phycisphaerae bacterium]|nr:hypothetical protein [Phycisphaerae bacterium]